MGQARLLSPDLLPRDRTEGCGPVLTAARPSQRPSLAPGLRGAVHFPTGVVWAFLPVFVFSEKLGGCQRPHWAVGSQESLASACRLTCSEPALLPLQGRCASGQGFLLPQGVALEGSPFPAAPWRGGGAAV